LEKKNNPEVEVSKDQASSIAANDPVIKANYANFGHIPYGQSLMGTLIFDPNNPDQCKRTDAHELLVMEEKIKNAGEG